MIQVVIRYLSKRYQSFPFEFHKIILESVKEAFALKHTEKSTQKINSNSSKSQRTKVLPIEEFKDEVDLRLWLKKDQNGNF